MSARRPLTKSMTQLQVAGSKLEVRSDILRNPDDDFSMLVFAPDIRCKTDRFVLRLRKARSQDSPDRYIA